MNGRARAGAVVGLALLACSVIASCTRPYEGSVTVVEVEVATNFAPGEVDRIELRVGHDDASLTSGRAFPASALLPPEGGVRGRWALTFQIVPASGDGGTWVAEASAWKGTALLVSVRRRGGFSKDQKRTVRILLDRQCIDLGTGEQRTCPRGLSCGRGGVCIPESSSDEGAPSGACSQAGARVVCVAPCGQLGEASCEQQDGALALGECRPFREIAGDGIDNDCDPATPDDGSCGATARGARDGFFDDEVCIAGGELWLGNRAGRARFVAGSAAFFSGEPTLVPSSELPARRVRVSAFWVDTYEVSVARFREFWASSERPAQLPAPVAEEPEHGTFTGGAQDDGSNPVNYVDWITAEAFCEWDGASAGRRGRLPSDAEWEWIADHEGEQDFPWGDELPSCTLGWANLRWALFTDDSLPCDPAVTDEAIDCHFVGCDSEANTAPLSLVALARRTARLPDRERGLYGLVGNVAEWTLDHWSESAYSERCGTACGDTSSGDQNPYVDRDGVTRSVPRGPILSDAELSGQVSPGPHGVRGGSFSSFPNRMRSSARTRGDVPATKDFGFRCVRED